MSATELRRVLIVDDNLEICDILYDLLSSHGFTPKVCMSAEDAYEVVDSFSADVILLDLNMPGVDGLDGLMLFRSYTKHPDRPIIIVSALPKHEMESRTKDMGAYAYIQKPFSVPHLLQTIDNATRAHPVKQ